MNDRGAGPVSEASGCGGAAVTCGEIAVAGCENNSRRAEDVVKQHNSIEMCDAITDQQIPDAILCHFKKITLVVWNPQLQAVDPPKRVVCP